MDDAVRTLDDHRGAQPADVAGDRGSTASFTACPVEQAEPPTDPTPLTLPTWELNGVLVTTPANAATLIGVCRRSIYHWIEQEWIRVRYTPSGQMRVVVEDLLQEDGVARQGRGRGRPRGSVKRGTGVTDTVEAGS